MAARSRILIGADDNMHSLCAVVWMYAACLVVDNGVPDDVEIRRMSGEGRDVGEKVGGIYFMFTGVT